MAKILRVRNGKNSTEQKEEDAKAASRQKWCSTTEEAYKKIKRKCPEIAYLRSAKFITFTCGWTGEGYGRDTSAFPGQTDSPYT